MLFDNLKKQASSGVKPVGGTQRTQLTAAVAAALLAAVSLPAMAQSYPDKPIRLIVPTAPGGANDILARAIGPRLTDVWRQPVVVDNRAGGSGIIGAALVAKAKPDGYTLALASISHIAISPSVFPQKPYDAERDFAPVIQLVDQPVVFAAHPSFAARTVQDIVALAKNQRDAQIFGSPGVGSVMHLAGEMLQERTGLRLLHVPYKGGGPAVIDLVGGQVPLLFVGLAPALPHIRSGRIKAIAVAGARRATVLPNVPTIGETLPGYQVNFWAGVLAPAATPAAIVSQLNREIGKILHMPAMNQQLRDASFDIIAGTPQQFATAIRDDVRRWVPVVRIAGIKPE